eukprot:943472-Pleurochrysis_carterae.AAC.2
MAQIWNVNSAFQCIPHGTEMVHAIRNIRKERVRRHALTGPSALNPPRHQICCSDGAVRRPC